MPRHKIYVEPFGGMASVLMRKPRVFSEVVNDLDGQVVNLYRVLRDPVASARLAEGLALTPFSREEYEAAYLICSDPVEMARRFLVRASMGHGSNAATRKIRSGFRAKRAGAASPACDFSNYPSQVALFHARLQGVTIERKPALDILERYDSPDTLFYLDPPYVTETRTLNHTSYRHEFLDEDHEQLAAALNDIQGMAIISGYRCDLYDQLFDGWMRIDMDTWADASVQRVESLWFNPAASRRQNKQAVLPLTG
jgi:DNA adenine methylase